MKIDDTKYQILLKNQDIEQLVNSNAKNICDYIIKNSITEIMIVPLMNGAMFYATDLVRQLHAELLTNEITNCGLQIHSIHTSSYKNNSNEGTELICNDIDMIEVQDKIVLLLDDVFDSGNTLKWVMNKLQEKGAKTILTSVFMNKLCNHNNSYQPNFSAYELNENKFLVGYGMDDNGFNRELFGLYYIV